MNQADAAASTPVESVPRKQDFVMQPNWITEASYRLTINQKRILAIGMSRCAVDNPKGMSVSIKIRDIIKCLGLEDGGKQLQIIEDTYESLHKEYIKVKKPHGGWRHISWIEESEYFPEERRITMTFTRPMRDEILKFSSPAGQQFLSNLAQIQGEYSMRLYEMILSRQGFSGQTGRKGSWWFYEVSKEELRERMGIEDHEYLRTDNFKNHLLVRPIKELNSLDLGIRITEKDFEVKERNKIIGFKIWIRKETLAETAEKKKIIAAVKARKSKKRKSRGVALDNDGQLIDQELMDHCMKMAEDQLELDFPDTKDGNFYRSQRIKKEAHRLYEIEVGKKK